MEQYFPDLVGNIITFLSLRVISFAFYFLQAIFQTSEPFPDFIFSQPCLFISLWTVDFGEITPEIRI
jgi:hypothetical protein